MLMLLLLFGAGGVKHVLLLLLPTESLSVLSTQEGSHTAAVAVVAVVVVNVLIAPRPPRLEGS